MEKLVITGGKKLIGEVAVSGAKNVALKALVAACLTDDSVTIHNIPLISDFYIMTDIIKQLGGKISISDHSVTVQIPSIKNTKIPLDEAARIRTSSMFLAPLLAREKKAIIPNPGGCRLGARPIDRLVDGLRKMGAHIEYHSDDGYFYAHTVGLKGTTYRFEKSTHTGTETLILAAVLAEGKTLLENAAAEPEIDDLIRLLNQMGAKVKRTNHRTIEIEGVEKLSGTTFTIMPDRNEIVTFAIVAIITGGDVLVKDAKKEGIEEFLEKLNKAHGGFEEKENGLRFFAKDGLLATSVTTAIYPGFMTDWQAPWTVLMTKADGESIIHETVFENKMGYIKDLKKMGARAELFNPEVENPEKVYNFNLSDNSPEYFHAVRVNGPTKLHNAVLSMQDIRAGAAIVLAALAAEGESTIFGVEKLDRGYEQFEKRLQNLGAEVKRIKEK